MKNKQYIFVFLLFISTVLVIMPAIPHHHHGDGIICMKDDIKETDCCSSHHQAHHHQADDPCCNGDCAAYVVTSVPGIDTDDIQPEFTCIQILFTESMLRFLTQPIEKDVYKDFVYIESLHGAYLTRAAGLRAPPVL